MGTKWTDEQLSAIETRHCNLLVAAAAGSGKTAVLVERIIKMITEGENPVDIDRLLVVTFTNAAAAEMRERIGDAISKELEDKPNSQILQRQLALLNRASITTMHSFCLDVIKNNFHLIDLDPGFRIGDTTECTLIKQDILVDLFEDKYTEGDECFLGLVEAYGGNKSDDKLNDIILDLYDFAMSGPWPERWLREKAEEFNVNSIDDINNAPWSTVLKQSISVDLESFEGMLNEAIDISENTGGLDTYLENLTDDIRQLKTIENSLCGGLDETYKALSSIKFTTLKRTKKADVEDEKAQEKVKKLRDDVKKAINKLKDDVFALSLEETVDGMKKMYPLMKCLTDLVIEFSNRYDDKKREKGILDFNDLEHLCLKILFSIDEEGNIVASSVAENFREKFEEVLVDEYQDSNNVQETIINMVSRKTLENPNVFMVGDVKQSIYRFRQAKPELFLEKYNTYKEEAGEGNRKIMLYKNFRSRNGVINGVNYIFKSLMSEIVGELRYDEKEALNLGADYKTVSEETVFGDEDLDNINVAGDIELHILDRSGEYEENSDENQNSQKESFEGGENSSDRETEEDLDAIQLESRIISKKIRELINPSDGSSYMVWDKGLSSYRKIKYKDIVILLRATKNWADTFVEELGFDGIPVYADTGTGYFQTIEIRTIMALLHIIDNPMQDIYILAALRSPIFSFTSEELADVRLLNKDKYFYLNIKAIADGEHNGEVTDELIEKCRYFMSRLVVWREKSLYTPIDEFIWYLYSDTSYYGYAGAMPNGIQRQANLRILFQRAKQYEATSFKGLFNFINFINKLKKSSGDLGSAKILGENEDVVRIMSIHKSKGLEFPVVFLSGAGKQFNLMDLNKNLLFHEDLGIGAECVDVEKRIAYPTLQKYAIKQKIKLQTLSEEMRILYVAFTRAKEKLIITGAVNNLEKALTTWCKAASVNHDFGIAPSEVLKGKSYLQWIGMALAKHRNGEKIREGHNIGISIIDNEASQWQVKYWTKNELAINENLLEEVSEEERKYFVDGEVENIDEEVKRRLEYKYKYSKVCDLPSNISVSDIKKAEYEAEQEEVMSMFKVDFKRKPKFIQEEKGLSAAERGTAVHFVMQNINLDYINSINQIKDQIEDMVNRELITLEQGNAVNPFKVQNFFKSDLGTRMLEAYHNGKQVYRELPFVTDIPITRINKELEVDLYQDENLRLQGIIDCFFEEEDGVVLLDYKTDYAEEGMEQEILDRYQVQIQLYADTLEKITGKKVKEKWLYLFGLEKGIRY